MMPIELDYQLDKPLKDTTKKFVISALRHAKFGKSIR